MDKEKQKLILALRLASQKPNDDDENKIAARAFVINLAGNSTGYEWANTRIATK